MIHRGANRYKVVVGNGVFVLPPEYQRVEYIEGTGTQWIDTGLLFNEDIEYTARFLGTTDDFSTRRHIVGNFKSGNRYRLSTMNDYKTLYWWFGNVAEQAQNLYNVDYVHNITDFIARQDNIKVYQNGTKIKDYDLTTEFIQNNETIKLFYDNTSSYGKFIGRFYFFTAKENDTPVRNMIPCYRHSDGVAGMYDTVNGVFYTNQGTGSFIVGNNVYGGTFTVPEPIPNGYVNHIRGTATADFDFTLKYIDDKTNAVTEVTEHAVIDGNGHWDVKYEGKKIKEFGRCFYNNKSLTTIEFTETMERCTSWEYSGSSTGFMAGCSNLTKVKFVPNTLWNGIYMCDQFMNCTSLTTIENLSTVRFGSTQYTCLAHADTYGTFAGCTSLNNVDISGLDFTNIRKTLGMFHNCPSITNLYVPTNGTLCNSINLRYLPLTYESMYRVAQWLKDYTDGAYVITVRSSANDFNNRTVDWYIYENGEYVIVPQNASYVSSAKYYILEVQTVTFHKATYDALTQEQKDTLYDIIHTQKNWTLATANP